MQTGVVTPRLNSSSRTDAHLSPNVWRRFPIEEIQCGRRVGRFLYDDFQDFPLAGTQTTQIAHGRYKIFNSGATLVDRVSAVNSVEVFGGALRINLDTDNDSGSLAQSYPSYRMSGLPATDGVLCAEFCYAQNSIATNMASVFFGLAEVELITLATAVPLNAGNSPVADGALIGFRIEEDGLGVVDTVYADRATSFTNIGDTEGGTLAANTFKKFGIRYDPKDATGCVRFFVDNVETATPLTRAALVALTHLDANALGLLIAACADSGGTSFNGFLKWWAVGQLDINN